jgi:hypothetical protein
MKPYIPREGSKTKAVIDHLHACPVGTHLDTTVLGQILDVHPSFVQPLLKHPLKLGVLGQFIRQRRLYICLPESMPDDVDAPIVRRATSELLDPEDVCLWPVERRVVPAAGLPLPHTCAVRSVFDLGAAL